MRKPVLIALAASFIGSIAFVGGGLVDRPRDAGASGAAASGRDALTSVRPSQDKPAPAAPAPRTVQQEAVSRFELGYAGGVLVNESTRRTLEMASSTLSSPPTEEELAGLQAQLSAGLPFEEVNRIMALTRGYVGYTAELEREVPVGPEPTTLVEYDATVARIDGIRRRNFDADTSAALFGPHDAHARLVLEASLVETDRRLTGEQKLAKLAHLRAQLPSDQQHLISAPADKS